jgi:hypothetical protein
MFTDFSFLTSAAECDAALDVAHAIRNATATRKSSLENLINTASTPDEIQAEIDELQSENTTLQAQLPTLSIGDMRELAERLFARNNVRLVNLNQRLDGMTVQQKADRILQHARVEVQVPAIDQYIALVEAHRATLPA